MADEGELVRVRITISGRVQMVGFRAFVVRNATNVGGVVRNLPNGGVECVAEGTRPNVERLVECVRQGPSSSRVDSVDVRWEPASGTYTEMRAG